MFKLLFSQVLIMIFIMQKSIVPFPKAGDLLFRILHYDGAINCKKCTASVHKR